MSRRSHAQAPRLRGALNGVSDRSRRVGSVLKRKVIKERASVLPEADSSVPYLGS